MQLHKFIPFTKRTKSDGTHEVAGLVTCEEPDKEGEECVYADAKVAYEAWSSEFQKATEDAGQELSLGNIRLMHQIQIAGKAIGIEYDDDSKAIFLKSTPVNDAIWTMVEKGFLTGYSQGGEYQYRVCKACGTDIPVDKGRICPKCKKQVTVRYAPIIAEVSYVDNPCLEQAHFAMVKSDGSVELVKLQSSEGGITMPPEAATVTAPGAEVVTVTAGGAATISALGLTEEQLTKISDRVVAALFKADKKTKRVAGVDLPASCFAYVGDKDDTSTWKLPISFPGDDEKTKTHIRNALARFNQTKGIPDGEKDKVKAKIVAAAKKHDIDTAAEEEKAEKARKAFLSACTEVLDKTAEKRGLKKGLYEVQSFANLLEGIAWLHSSAVYEEAWEQDGSALPEDLLSLLENAAEAFIAMAEEETDELTAQAAGRMEGKTMSLKTLSKAARKSITDHLGAIKKAAQDHHDEMCEAHKDHLADVNGMCDKMGKILGAEEGDKDEHSASGENEPESINLESAGTPNIQKGDNALTLKKNKDGSITIGSAEELTKFLDARDELIMNQTAQLVIKAMKNGEEEDGEDDEEEKPKPKAKKGIGDRSTLPTAVAGGGPAIRVMPVTKAADTEGAAAPVVVTRESAENNADLMSKALRGDPEAAATFMKGVKVTSNVPSSVATLMRR